METLKIELRNRKAYKILQDMEALKLIRLIEKKPSSKISGLRKEMRTPMTEKQIEKQTNSLRKEWKQNI